MKNYQKNAIFPSVLVSCMKNQLIHAEYEKTHYGICRSLIWRCIWIFGSNGLQTKWILVALAQTESHLHAMFMHHIVAYACVLIDWHRSFSIGPAPETVPEYLSEEQCPLVDLPGKQTPLFIPIQSYSLAPALSYCIRTTTIHLLLCAAVVEPIPLHDLSLPQ